MSDTANVASDVANDVVDEIDVGSVLTGDDDVLDDVDGQSLGRSVGETLGEALGRALGRGLVDWLLSKLTFWDDDDPSLSARFAKSLLVAVGRTLRKPEFKEPVGDALRGAIDRLEERQEAAKEAAAEASDEATDAADEAKETAEDAKASAEDASDAAGEKASEAAEALQSGQMDELRKETYRELLEMMEYSKLQSIAKESDVKANLPKDEMVDAIVEQFDAAETEDGADDDGE
ncbi:hypothetical protein SAMN04487947_3087 [Halogeometricum rufum]|uniref:Uncharacterized protein n=1 Tax=Halogeometricum rufum TaxID=553469 RepID=A0A1I6IA93_9EURY|nr:hypothetical protein [Halogeometricum rufum]SFR63300.1 hypothetical protein SAMN04487947_3087 [Halogeometricum rufum]